MKEKILAKRQRRLEIYHQLRALEKDTGIKSAEDRQIYDRLIAEQRSLKEEIDRLEEMDGLKSELDSVSDEERSGAPVVEARATQTQTAVAAMNPEQRDLLNRAHYYNWMRTGDKRYLTQIKTTETRDLQMDADTAGGYTVQYESFANDFIKLERNLNYSYGKAKHYTLSKARQLTIPALSAEVADPTFTAEISMGSEDSTFAFKQHIISVYPIAQYIQISTDLLAESNINMESEVRDSLAYKSSYVKNYNIVNGVGANGPLGYMVASDSGVSTNRDVTFASATALDADTFKDAKYGVDTTERGLHPMWWPDAEWIFHPYLMGAISKLKDGNGQYLLQPGSIALGSPDMLEGFPVRYDHSVPKTMTSGLYVGVLANLAKGYAVVDGLDMGIRRLDEIAARSNLVEFHSRAKFGGKPINEECFSRLKMG